MILRRIGVVLGAVLLLSIEVAACVDVGNHAEPTVDLRALRLLEP